MAANNVTVTEAVRHFSDYVNRVVYRHESFILCRGSKAIAELRPLPLGRRLGDLPGILKVLPKLSVRDATDMRKAIADARAALPAAEGRDPWAF